MKWPLITLRRHVRELQFWRKEMARVADEWSNKERELNRRLAGAEAAAQDLYQVAATLKHIGRADIYHDYKMDAHRIYLIFSDHIWREMWGFQSQLAKVLSYEVGRQLASLPRPHCRSCSREATQVHGIPPNLVLTCDEHAPVVMEEMARYLVD
jgi:hypothetical protein